MGEVVKFERRLARVHEQLTRQRRLLDEPEALGEVDAARRVAFLLTLAIRPGASPEVIAAGREVARLLARRG
jgi:hypothetical protein